MSIRDLIPTRENSVRLNRRTQPSSIDLFHREIDRLFDRMFYDVGIPTMRHGAPAAWHAAWPAVNVAEDKENIVVTAELPGVDEKDLSVDLDEDILTLSGQTETEKEEKGRRWTRVERMTGSFHRAIELPCAVQEKHVKASFKHGILTVRLPKAEPEASKHRVIPIE